MPKILTFILFLVVTSLAHGQTEEILNPVDDAYLQRSSFSSNTESRYNDETLRVENASNRVRDSYLKFDLSGINGTITALELELTVYTDPGSGTINVYKGVGNNWTEDNLSNSNKPSTPGSPLGSFSGSHVNNAVKTLSILPSNIDSSQLLSIVIKHTTNSDVAFGSTGPETSSIFDQAPASKWPKLKVTYTPTSAADTQAPNVPTGLAVNSFDHESANISWNSANDNGGGNVVGYTLYDNGNPLATTTATSYNLAGLLPNRLYQLSIDAYDNASPVNISAKSTPTINFTTSSNPNSGLTITSFTATLSGTNDVQLNWSVNNDNLATNGQVWYNEGNTFLTSNNVGPFQFSTGDRSLLISNLVSDKTYTFAIDIYQGTSQGPAQSQVTIYIPDTGGTVGTGGYWTKTGSDLHYTSGNVGIGTTDPGSWQLAVNGNVRAKEVKVESSWADYVFFKDYKLPTLQEVEKHIEEHGHLINIPSVDEVEANGIELGEMNKLLLEKIEELTLYIIGHEKRINELELKD